MASLPLTRLLTAGLLVLTGLLVTGQDEELIRLSNSFAHELYNKLAAEAKDENVVTSPISLSVALAMLASGAHGNTAAELYRHLLGRSYDFYGRSLRGYGDIYNSLQDVNSQHLSTANLLYPSANFRLQDSYIESIRTRFNATVDEVDYSKESTTQRIVEDVKQATRGKVEDLFGESRLDAETSMILISTALFKGIWEVPFPMRYTGEKDFYASDGTSREGTVQMMNDPKRELPYTYDPELRAQAVQIKYTNSTSSMLVILPDAGSRLGDVRAQLTPDKLQSLLDSMVNKTVNVWLPKFKIESSHDLSDTLRGLGVSELFDSRGIANLEGMTSKEGLYLLEAYQWATIEVTEQGSVDSESSAYQRRRLPDASHVFRANRPFIFAILSEVTNASYVPLLMGSFVSPDRK